MANLFWKKRGTTRSRSLLATPFKTEEEFERIVFENPELLEDIFFIRRQVRRGGKAGIPDIIGVDNDGNICIVEMKNTTVDSSIILQILQYVIWAENNPDSIKALWLECENKPDDISVNWDNPQIRIVVIAPNILRSALGIVSKINYQMDMIEIQRWVEGKNQLLLVNKLEEDLRRKVKTATGLVVYDEEFYKRQYNKNSVNEFIRYVREVETVVKQKKWTLETKFNKHYCGFKAGFFNAFGVKWIGSKTFAFFFKLSQKEAKKTKLPMTKYENLWKEATYYIEPGKTKTKNFLPLLKMAYQKLTGG
jgi:hypothetical protein